VHQATVAARVPVFGIGGACRRGGWRCTRSPGARLEDHLLERHPGGSPHARRDARAARRGGGVGHEAQPGDTRRCAHVVRCEREVRAQRGDGGGGARPVQLVATVQVNAFHERDGFEVGAGGDQHVVAPAVGGGQLHAPLHGAHGRGLCAIGQVVPRRTHEHRGVSRPIDAIAVRVRAGGVGEVHETVRHAGQGARVHAGREATRGRAGSDAPLAGRAVFVRRAREHTLWEVGTQVTTRWSERHSGQQRDPIGEPAQRDAPHQKLPISVRSPSPMRSASCLSFGPRRALPSGSSGSLRTTRMTPVTAAATPTPSAI
jgi:hypothetical protein